jgi:hypothetical protein
MNPSQIKTAKEKPNTNVVKNNIEATENKYTQSNIKKDSITIAKWQELLAEIKNRNNSVYAFLKVCNPDFTDEELVLSFPFKFHKERVEDPKSMLIVEAAANKVYRKPYKIKCVFKPHLNNAETKVKPRNDDLLVDALEIFGGEVIE